MYSYHFELSPIISTLIMSRYEFACSGIVDDN